MPFAPPKTYQNKKSFWIFQTYPQIIAKRHVVSSKICFMKHPNVHSIQIKYLRKYVQIGNYTSEKCNSEQTSCIPNALIVRFFRWWKALLFHNYVRTIDFFVLTTSVSVLEKTPRRYSQDSLDR